MSTEHKERLQLAPFPPQPVGVLGALMEEGLSPLWTLGSGGQRHWWCSLFPLLEFPITTFPELMEPEEMERVRSACSALRTRPALAPLVSHHNSSSMAVHQLFHLKYQTQSIREICRLEKTLKSSHSSETKPPLKHVLQHHVCIFYLSFETSGRIHRKQII